MALRNYVNTSKEGQLSLPIGAGDTTITLTAPGLVNIPSTPFYVRLDPDTASEEIILVGAGSSATSLQNCTRGFDGTSAFSHLAGAKARHCVAAEFYNKADVHVEATTNVHGLSGGAAVVGTTQTQTLTNKTVNSSVIDLAHSSSPAGSQAVKVSANDATSRDGFVWDNTGGSSGRSLVVRSGGVDRFVVSGAGLVTSNSATGTDKALAVQQSATERFFIQNDGHADFALQAGGATVDRVRIRTQSTQNALAVKDSGGTNIFTVSGSGAVDASGNIASAAAVSSGTTMSVGTNLTVNGTLAVTGASTLTGNVTLPLPAAGTTQRVVVNSRTGGTNFEGRNQAGTATFFVRETGQLGIAEKALIHNSASPVVAEVSGTGVVPSPTTDMLVFDTSDNTLKEYNGTTWDIVGRYNTSLANVVGLVGGRKRTADTAAISTTETEFVSSGSINLLASSVYLISMDVTFFCSVSNDDFILRIRDTNTAGSIRYQTVTYKGLLSTPFNQHVSFIYRTTTAETGRSFIGSVQRNTGTGSITVQGNTYLTVTYLGPTAAITDI